MKTRFPPPLAVALLVAAFALVAGWMSSRFPPVNVDEIIGANVAKSFVDGKGPRYALYDDVFASEGEAFRALSNSMARPLYGAWVGGWMKLVPFGWWTARLASTAAGVVTLVLLALCGRRMCVSPVAVIVLTLAQPVFWMASGPVNELILLPMAGAALLLFALDDRSSGERGRFALGALLPLPMLVHPYGVFLTATVAAVFVARRGWEGRRMAPLLGGAAAGALVVFLAAPWKDWLRYSQVLYFHLVRPPIAAFSTTSDWMTHLRGLFAHSASYYYGGAGDSASLVSAAGLLQWLAVAALLAAAALLASGDARERRMRQAMAGGAAGLAVFLGALSARREIFYLTLLTPFVSLLGAEVAGRVRSAGRATRSCLVAFALFQLAALSAFAAFGVRYPQRFVPHADTVAGLKARMDLTDAPRILAPPEFWFDFPRGAFRDIGALSTSRYYTGGRFEPGAWLAAWRPRYLVLNATVLKLLRPETPIQDFADRLGTPVTFLGEVDSADGPLYVLEAAWPPAAVVDKRTH